MSKYTCPHGKKGIITPSICEGKQDLCQLKCRNCDGPNIMETDIPTKITEGKVDKQGINSIPEKLPPRPKPPIAESPKKKFPCGGLKNKLLIDLEERKTLKTQNKCKTENCERTLANNNRSGFCASCNPSKNKLDPRRHVLEINFIHHLGILKALKDSADVDFRTPENQVVAILNRVLLKGKEK